MEYFKKNSLSKWRISLFDKKDFSALQSLFKQSFNKVLSPELRQWKYADKQAFALCTWNGSSLIGHYGGIPRDILFFGDPKKAIQMGDAMVDPSYRGGLSRKGPFFMMVTTVIQDYIGFNKLFLVGFGFPHARAMQSAKSLGLYTPIAQMLKFSWPAIKGKSYCLTTSQILQKMDLVQCRADINLLWLNMAKELKQDIVGVRDYSYIYNRYHQHPEHNYEFMLVKNRFTQKAQGLVIMMTNDECCEIIDLVCAIQEIPLLVSYAQHYAATQECTQLVCEITQDVAQHFTTPDAHCEVLDFVIATCSWSDGPLPEQLKGHWWAMSGDMDFR
jgi:hypothetical protein